MRNGGFKCEVQHGLSDLLSLIHTVALARCRVLSLNPETVSTVYRIAAEMETVKTVPEFVSLTVPPG